MLDEGARLSFTAEWIDPVQDYAYKFTLRYYVDDGDVELVRASSSRTSGRDGFFDFFI
jgi:hypothetical protein